MSCNGERREEGKRKEGKERGFWLKACQYRCMEFVDLQVRTIYGCMRNGVRNSMSGIIFIA